VSSKDKLRGYIVSVRFLKKENTATIVVFLMWNVALFIVAINGISTFWASIKDHIAELGARNSLFSFLTPIVLAIACGVLPASFKSVLVFWRFKNVLPGCRFMELANNDPRIDASFITEQFDTKPNSPHEQNAVWYKWYKAVQNQITVQEAHKQFLLNRDMTGIAFLFFIFGSPAIFFAGSSVLNSSFYLAITMLQFVIFSVVARNHGNRFVCNVLVEYQNKNS